MTHINQFGSWQRPIMGYDAGGSPIYGALVDPRGEGHIGYDPKNDVLPQTPQGQVVAGPGMTSPFALSGFNPSGTEDDPDTAIEQGIYEAAPPILRRGLDTGLFVINRGEDGLGDLKIREGPFGSLVSQSMAARLLDLPTGAGGSGLSPYQAESLALDRANVFGFGVGDDQTTLDQRKFVFDKEYKESAQLRDIIALLGSFPVNNFGIAAGAQTLGGRAQALDERLGSGRLAFDRELGFARLGLDRAGLGLDRELGLAGLGLDRESLDRLRALDAQNAALQREEMALRQGGLLGEIGGRQTLEAELGRGAQNLAVEQFLTERRRNPSDFISAQLAFGGPGQTVGDVMIPGRISEAIFGGDLPAASNRALTAEGRVGAMSAPGSSLSGANLVTPSLQMLNQLNPEEIQAVSAAVPFLTQGQTTPTQFFNQAQQLGLTGFG